MNDSEYKGYINVTAAYLIWGFLPVYWKLLHTVPALEVLAHRIIWAVVFLFMILAYKKSLNSIRNALQNKKNIVLLFISSCLVGSNWFLYIWAVNHDNIVETSLGYFICPLLSIVLGMVIFKEKLRKLQCAAIGIAAAGVLYLSLSYGKIPWIALALAVTFALYGAVKKQIAISAITGLFVETALLLIPALFYIVNLSTGNDGVFFKNMHLSVLLAAGGIATSIPLLLFAAGARVIPLSVLGFIQYLSPIFQLILGVFVYHEEFSTAKIAAFSLVWAALILYTADSIVFSMKHKGSTPGNLQPQIPCIKS